MNLCDFVPNFSCGCSCLFDSIERCPYIDSKEEAISFVEDKICEYQKILKLLLDKSDSM